jgi:hypothetical protein
MKTSSVSLCFLTATLFAVPAVAQADAPAAPPPPPAGEHRPLREEMLQRFDANHDGKLDEAERATARAEWQKRRAEHGGGWGRHEFAGRGGYGGEFHGRGLHHRHWRKMTRMRHWRRMHMRQAMLQRFDRDGDHHLSEAERADARKAGQEMRARFQEGRKQVLERFDANHDGRLDENERKGLRDAWQEFVKQRPVLAPAPSAPAGK